MCAGTVLLLFQLSFAGYGNWVKINSIDKLVPSVFWSCRLLVTMGRGAHHSFIRTQWLPHEYVLLAHRFLRVSITSRCSDPDFLGSNPGLVLTSYTDLSKPLECFLLFLHVKIRKTKVLNSGFALGLFI